MTILLQSLPILLFPLVTALNAGQAPAQKDELLRGIKQLAVVVDKMDAADAKCGITEDNVRAAASKALADNSLTVSAARQDFQPFLYIRTTSLHTSDGQCVSHILTTIRAYVAPPHFAWTPEQPASSVVEIVLQEQGGLVYSPDAAAHPQATLSAVGRYVGRFATSIKAANK